MKNKIQFLETNAGLPGCERAQVGVQPAFLIEPFYLLRAVVYLRAFPSAVGQVVCVSEEHGKGS